MAEDEGATPRELVLEACRRNNTDLLTEVIAETESNAKDQTAEEAVASLLNGTRDGMGNPALHVAALAGSYDVLDILLDQPGLEVDPLDRVSSETPLHKAVALCNSLPLVTPPAANATNATDVPAPNDHATLEEFLSRNEGHATVEILLDAGCDPRIRNKSRMKPVDLVDGRNIALKDFLRRAEFLLVEGEGVVNEDVVEEVDGAGSASDSD